MENWLNGLTSRANALKTDDELRLEFEKMAGPGASARPFKTQLETFLTQRGEQKRAASARHKEAPFDAQKDHLRERD